MLLYKHESLMLVILGANGTLEVVGNGVESEIDNA